jgi:hypothetical protein
LHFYPDALGVLQENRKSCSHGRDLFRLVQLNPHSQDFARHARNGRWLSKTVMSWEHFAEMMDADQPAKKRALKASLPSRPRIALLAALDFFSCREK